MRGDRSNLVLRFPIFARMNLGISFDLATEFAPN